MIQATRILGVIPARAGSKGVVDKNLRLLGDKPLIAYIIGTAAKSKRLARTILSTDGEKIAEAGRAYGAEVPFVRPPRVRHRPRLGR